MRACSSQKDWSEEKGGCRQGPGSEEMGRGGETVQTQLSRQRTAWVLPLSSKDWGHKTKDPNTSVLWLSESKDWQSGSLCGKHPNNNRISKKRNWDYLPLHYSLQSACSICLIILHKASDITRKSSRNVYSCVSSIFVKSHESSIMTTCAVKPRCKQVALNPGGYRCPLVDSLHPKHHFSPQINTFYFETWIVQG